MLYVYAYMRTPGVSRFTFNINTGLVLYVHTWRMHVLVRRCYANVIMVYVPIVWCVYRELVALE